MSEIRAVIFDMDGLLLDSERVYEQIWTGAAAECGLTLTRAQFLNLIGRGRKGALETVVSYFPGSFDPARLSEEVAKAEVRLLDECSIPLKPGVHELLDLLDARAVGRIVATSTRQAVALRRLDRVGLRMRFSDVIGGDQVERSKPAPDIFLKALSRLGATSAQTLVLEDSANGIRAAHAAGIPAIMVPDQLEPTDEIRRLCRAVVPSLADLPRELGWNS